MIFNDLEFHRLNGVKILHTDSIPVWGIYHEGVYQIGYSAPFAAFNLKHDEPSWCVQAYLGGFMEAKDMPVRVKLPPSCYSATWSAEVVALTNLGFLIERAELNQHLEPETAELSKSARKAEARGIDALLGLWEADTDEDWTVGYEILAANRAAKGRGLKLSLEYVLKMRDTFPGRVKMFTAGGVAAALVYEVEPGYGLVVYWGDDPGDLDFSPMPYLANALTRWARAERMRVLDLGISSVDGVIDPGLAQFKRSVGAKDSIRLDMVRGIE